MDQIVVANTNFIPPLEEKVLLRYHFVILALAGNDIATNCGTMSLVQIYDVMLIKYSEWVELFLRGSTHSEIPRPDRLNSAMLMVFGGKAVNGQSLWRKFGECKSCVLNHCNPLSVPPTSGQTRDDVLYTIREALWVSKETEAMTRRAKQTITPITAEWFPKEWLVFSYCAVAALVEDSKLATLCEQLEHSGNY